MTTKIDTIVPYDDFRANRRVQMLEIHYSDPATGLSGVLRLEKAGSTPASITAAVIADAQLIAGLIGLELRGK